MESIIYYSRHGIITGATGTGKTTTLKQLAKQMRAEGVNVIMVDIKGDVIPNTTAKVVDPMEGFAPLHTIDPIILSRLFNLNDTQTASLVTIFNEQDNIYDWEDLKVALDVYSNPRDYSLRVTQLPRASLDVIRRNMVFLEGASSVFGTQRTGYGEFTVIDATELQHYPDVYATLMFSLIDNMYRAFPEVGDENRWALLIDEAHLLFEGTTPRLQQLMDRRIRLIRSRGVGVWFSTQSAADLPDNIRAQMGTQIFHGARAYTKKEQQRTRAAVEGLRGDHKQLYKDIQELGIGEILFSTLTKEGVPTPATKERVKKYEI